MNRREVTSRRMAAHLERQRLQLTKALARRLKAYFKGLARLVVERYLADEDKTLVEVKAASPEQLLPPDEVRRLSLVIGAVYQHMLEEASASAAAQVGLDPLPAADQRMQELLRHSATRVVKITDATREAIRRTLQAAQEAGYSPRQVAAGVPADGFRGLRAVVEEIYRDRAFVIAHTEMAYAAQDAAHERYIAAGVTMVDVRDGEDCGLTEHDDPEKVNGKRYPIETIIAYPLAHPRCLVGGALVLTVDGLPTASFSRRFDGEVIILRASGNDLLTCTPNHPILTPRGWVMAGALQEGDDVLQGSWSQWAGLLGPNNHNAPALIEEVADTNWPARGSSTTSMPSSPEDFHGDGAGSDVYVVRTNGAVDLNGIPSLNQPRRQRAVTGTYVRARTLPPLSFPAEIINRLRDSADSRMRMLSETQPVSRAHVFHSQQHGVTVRSKRPAESPECRPEIAAAAHTAGNGYAALARQIAVVERPASLLHGIPGGLMPASYWPTKGMEALPQGVHVDSNGGRDLAKALAGVIQTARLSEVLRSPFHGHVYNLETSTGWYIANGIVTHNCRRVSVPVLPGRE